MDLSEYRAGILQRHPWEITRFDFLYRQLRQNPLLQSGQKILDVGSGDAWFAASLVNKLKKEVSITCWDTEYGPDVMDALKAQAPRLYLQKEAPTGRFDGLMLLDVLEHVEQDREFLHEIVSARLEKDAWALITVPIWQKLYGEHDRKLRHFRRYDPIPLKKLLEESGLEILRSGQMFRLLFLLRLLQVGKEKALGKGEASNLEKWNASPLVDQLVVNTLRFDNFIFEKFEHCGVTLPGLSWWGLCRKK